MSGATSICMQVINDTQKDTMIHTYNQRDTINPSKNVNKVSGNIDLFVGHQRNTKRHEDTQRYTTSHN